MRTRCFLWQRLRRKKADLGDFAIGDERPDRTKLAYDSLFHISPLRYARQPRRPPP